MGTPHRDRYDCIQCGSENTGRITIKSPVSENYLDRLHVVKCLDCGFSGVPETTPDKAFRVWDILNKPIEE